MASLKAGRPNINLAKLGKGEAEWIFSQPRKKKWRKKPENRSNWGYLKIKATHEFTAEGIWGVLGLKHRSLLLDSMLYLGHLDMTWAVWSGALKHKKLPGFNWCSNGHKGTFHYIRFDEPPRGAWCLQKEVGWLKLVASEHSGYVLKWRVRQTALDELFLKPQPNSHLLGPFCMEVACHAGHRHRLKTFVPQKNLKIKCRWHSSYVCCILGSRATLTFRILPEKASFFQRYLDGRHLVARKSWIKFYTHKQFSKWMKIEHITALSISINQIPVCLQFFIYLNANIYRNNTKKTFISRIFLYLI